MATFEELKFRADQWKGKRDFLKEEVEREARAIAQTTQDLEEIKAAIQLLQYIAQETNKANEEQTATLATLALQETFDDQELSLVVEHETYRNHPGVTFKLVDRTNPARIVEGDPLDSFGGGPAAIIGLVLQVISIVRQPELTRILILDEPLPQVSKSYQQAAGKLLRKLCDPPPRGLNFKMLVITHMEALANEAHTRYSATRDPKGEGVLITKETPDE